MAASHAVTEHAFRTHDGEKLFYRAWTPAEPNGKALLVFHRGHEHSGRVVELVQELALEGFHVFAWDARGHGNSPGERGYAEHLGVIVKDADCFARHLAATRGIPVAHMAVLAHSVGAAIAATWVHDYAPPISALVLAVPAFKVKLYVPFAVPALRLKQKLLGKGFVKSYVKATFLTHDPGQARAYAADDKIFRQIAVNILLDLNDTSRRVVQDAGAITVPTLMMAAGSDWVVRRRDQLAFYRRLSSPVKEFHLLPGFYHAIFHEKDRHVPISLARRFILENTEDPAPRIPLRFADRGGYTRQEFDQLSIPDGFSRWSLMRASMRTLGRLSAGIRLGLRTGFDSGETLDYVYANRPKGSAILGWFMDRSYLNSIGWRGIRQRRVHMEQMLARALRELQARKGEVRILDIAAGVGRYVLETLKAMPEIKATALLRDYREANLEAGRRLAQDLGVTNVEFQLGDAFDRASLAALQPRPDLAIVSGLYELIPDNTRVRASLAGLAEAMDAGGILLYTGQPWHPQVEFIARVLGNREGQAWIMRRRTQGEMDALVAEAGFEKLDMAIDTWGIFTVSLAVRR